MTMHMPPTTRSAPARTAAACILLGLSALAGSCGPKDDANAYVAPPPPEVVCATPVQRDVTKYLTYTGVIEASETVDLRARVQGFLEKVNFQPGQRVSKGDVLFVIDKRSYQAAVEQADAAVRSQKAALQGAESDARLARELADQRAGPEIDAIIKAARKDVVAADLAAAEAQLSEARLNLEYCEVVAPIAGRISRNLVDVGNLVGRGEPTLLAQIVQAVPAFVSVDMNEADVLELRDEKLKSGDTSEPGQVGGEWRTAELGLATESAFAFKGRVDYVEPRVNPETGTLRIRTRYENADESLVPGLFARVRFPIISRPSILVPEAALLSDQQGRYAMTVNVNNEVEIRRVRVGILDGSMRVVEEGLAATDRVIVLGVLKARPGAKVTPRMQDAAAVGR